MLFIRLGWQQQTSTHTSQQPSHSQQHHFLNPLQVGFINWHKGERLDVEEYEHYEQVGSRMC
jgi:hypothetical protein